MYENKKIFICGLARSGYEVAKFLKDKNNQITVVDENEHDEHIEELKNLGVNVIIVNRDLQGNYLDKSFDVVIKNPGVPLNSSTVLKANELNIPIVNEVEVAFHYLPKNVKIIGITGSNGKTTTTTITYEILKQAGLPVHLGGNIGIPFTKMLEDIKSGDIIILEVSSQQLNDFHDFKTDIAVFTNINESHLDFFGTYEYYQGLKQKIFNHHTENNVAIINLNDDLVMKLASDVKSRKITFSIDKTSNLQLINNAINYDGKEIIKLTDIKLVGNHNYENCMCAIAVAKEFNVSNEDIKAVLSEFSGVEHRLQFVKTVNGRDFYNDSKATNVVATQIALGAFSTPVILLLGGMDRGHSFDDLIPYLKYTKAIMTYGETKNRIKEWADKQNIECIVFATLEEATRKAYEISEEKDTILLSPACASWDQYKKFEDRGDEFIRVVNTLQ